MERATEKNSPLWRTLSGSLRKPSGARANRGGCQIPERESAGNGETVG
jgi:hypothetical protein